MKRFVLASALSISVLACGPAVQPAICTATTYPEEGFTENAAQALTLRTALKSLNDPMKLAESSTANLVTAAQLETLWAAGTPSLKSITTPAHQALVSEIFTKFAAASGSTWTPVDPPAGPGGIYGSWIFSSTGVDLRQVMEKGLFGSGHYAEAARLMTPSATAADVDTMLALFGAHPSFPMDDKAATNPDVMTAVYAKRRTNPAAATPGPYLAIKAAFMNARAAVTGGAECTAQRDEAFASIREQWERTLLGTVVYYLTSSSATLEKPAPTVVEQASALHAIGETIGFLRGLRGLPASERIITDAQLDQVLTTLTASSIEGAQAYRFVTDRAATVDKLGAAISQIQSARQFSAEEINAFKLNF